jgi:hypothetical protein
VPTYVIVGGVENEGAFLKEMLTGVEYGPHPIALRALTL